MEEQNTDSIVMSLVRHVVQFVGGGLTAYGVVAADDVQAASGAIIGLVAAAWAICKRRNVKICQA